MTKIIFCNSLTWYYPNKVIAPCKQENKYKLDGIFGKSI